MKVKYLSSMALAGIGLVACGGGGVDQGGSPEQSIETHGAAESRPPGEIVEVPPSAIVKVKGPDGELAFIDVNGSTLVVGNTGIETAAALSRSILHDGDTPLEAYMGFAQKDAAAPEFLVKDHVQRTARAPVAMVLPTVTPGLHIASLQGSYTDTCSTANLQATANVGLPSFTSSLTVAAPNPFDNSTQWISTGAAPQAYVYLACATSGSSTANFFIKSHSMTQWMSLPWTASGNNVVYTIHSTLWADGVGDASNNLDLWASMSTSSNVNVHGRVGAAQP